MWNSDREEIIYTLTAQQVLTAVFNKPQGQMIGKYSTT
jgi:hypothetical protein